MIKNTLPSERDFSLSLWTRILRAGIPLLSLFLLLGGCSRPTAKTVPLPEEATLPEKHAPAPADPGKWRGFNLTDMIGWGGYGHEKKFQEWDFQAISKLGFNYVRLPLDCRIWLVKDQASTVMDEEVLKRLDQAVAWGQKYGVHVNLNLHRAPGYCVNTSLADDGHLWTDPKLQELFVYYWRELAKRYKDVPASDLSFNLVNEPRKVTPEAYATLAMRASKVIWEMSPERLVFVDGILDPVSDGPLPGLDDPRIWQSTHNYKPAELTNYGVTWRGKDWIPFLARPIWPMPLISKTLLGPSQANNPKTASEQKEFAGKPVVMLDLKDFPGGLFRVRVMQVSGVGASLQIAADGVPLATWELVPFKMVPNPKTVSFGRDYYVRIPAGTQRIDVSAPVGDWIELNQIGFQPDGGKEVMTPVVFQNKYSSIRPEPIVVDLNSSTPFKVTRWMDQEWLYEEMFSKWHKVLGKHFFVGEFGAFAGTPHEAALPWMEDNLRNFKKMGVGWALWEFRGGWGVLDSKRTDVDYEEWEGHKLDRKMLELLQKY